MTLDANTPTRHRSTYRPPTAPRPPVPEPGGSDGGFVIAPPTAADPVGAPMPPTAADPAGAPMLPTAADPAGAPMPPTAADPAGAPMPPTAADAPVSDAARRRGRHRAERRGNRRPTNGLARRIAAVSGITSLAGACVLGTVPGADAETPTDTMAYSANAATKAEAARDSIRAAQVRLIEREPAITGALSTTEAPFTGGTEVSVTGEHLDEVASVVIGGVPATIDAVADDELTFAVPATGSTALGTVPVEFLDVDGDPIGTRAPADARPAASVDPAAAIAAAARPAPAAFTLTYTSDPRIDAQVGYVLAYWQHYNTAEFTVIDGYDCANFASQSLLKRGWAMDAGWWYDPATGATSPSWVSSTAMRDWLASRPDLATPLEDGQRDRVKVGDIAQFDWDDSGDRDHTAVVTRVEHTGAGTKVWVGGHTKDADFWDVDQALATGGGSVHYFSLR